MSRFLTTAGEQVAELIELSADEGRLSRGRALYRKGAVSDLTVMDGSVIASVRGSQGDDYETTISTTPAPPGVQREFLSGREQDRSVDELIEDGIDICPREIDLAFTCDCPDWDEPCKHAAAVVLAFADRVDLDEAELLRWRGLDRSRATDSDPERGSSSTSRVVEAEDARPRDGSSRPSREPPSPRQPPSPEPAAPSPHAKPPDAADRTAKLSELKSLLGDTAMQASTGDSRKAARRPSALEPALAEFVGLDLELDPVDLSSITSPPPLFDSMELGPLADLGPELAEALAIISARLSSSS